MTIWITIIVAIIMIANSWVLKWVDLATKIPESEKNASKSKVNIRRYKTGIVMALLLVSVSTLAYLMLSTLPISKVTILLIAVNVCAVLMSVLSWILITNNAKIKKLIDDQTSFAHFDKFGTGA